MSVPLLESPDAYERMLGEMDSLSKGEQVGHLRNLALDDLYFFLRFILRRKDLWEPPLPTKPSGERIWLSGAKDEENPSAGPNDEEKENQLLARRRDRWRAWCFERCREVQKDPDGRLDKWPRGQYKSTIVTYGLTLQNILRNPDERVGIFSNDNPTAESHLTVIKQTLEQGEVFLHLLELFPDILWERPEVEAPLWSVQKGITVRRKRVAKEPTLSAYGLVEGLPTGPHFDLLVYDDTVTKDSVRTPEQIKKTTEAWEHSLGLRAAGARSRYVGTTYHFADTYTEIEKRKAATIRKYAAETEDGGTTMYSKPELEAIRETMGPTTYASQMMQDPRADTALGFSREWLERCKYAKRPEEIRKGLNVYIVVDPASSKKKKSNDYTAGWVIGLGPDRNYYVLDMERDRLNLKQRRELVFNWHKTWAPIAVGYEEYGLQADIESIQEEQERENYRFPITAVKGPLAKEDRIRKLGPIFQAGRIWFPGKIEKPNAEGRVRDLVETFILEEYAAFPVGGHDDQLDALARILDDELGARFPSAKPKTETNRERPARNWKTR